MDELEISGKRYISTRRAAREHGYHSDYMGQLVRGKKVLGQKVGRSWYIEEGSLNAYLGKATLAPEPVPVPKAPAPAPVPVEQVVVEAPAVAAAPAPAPVAAAEPVHHAAPQPVYAAPQPVAPAPVMPAEVAAPVAASAPITYAHAQQEYVAPRAQPRYIEHPPLEETRIPVRAQTVAEPLYQEPMHGGLRYAEDDAPSLPTMTKMPQQPQYYAEQYAPLPAPRAAFPYIGLSVIAGIAFVASIFASNFITATIVSEEGKAASVQYSIHW